MTTTAKIIGIATHLLVFMAALAIFYLGLGLGLSQHPMYGNALCPSALLIAVANVWWILRRTRRNRSSSSQSPS